MKHLVIVIALAAFSTPAFAEGSYQNADEIRLVRAVWAYVHDQVIDDCLSNSNALKVEAELILRRSGIRLSKSDPFYRLQISPFGKELKSKSGEGLGTCVVAMQFKLWRVAQVPEGHPALIIAYENGVFLVGSKSEMQEDLRTSVSEFVSDLANEILKAQGN